MNRYTLTTLLWVILSITTTILCDKDILDADTEHVSTTEQLASYIQESSLTPLDLTYVIYDSNHPFSIVFAYLTFMPLVIVVMLTTLILFNRDIEAIFQLAALIASTVINSVLKHIIKQPRPITSVKQGHGMPSDHSQFMFIYCTYLLLWIWLSNRYHINYTNSSNSSINSTSNDISYGINIGGERLWKIICSILLVTISCIVAYSRIFLGVHTIEQVIVGCIVGTILGIIWFIISYCILYKHIYPMIENSCIGRMLYVMDNGYKYNIIRYNYIVSKIQHVKVYNSNKID